MAQPPSSTGDPKIFVLRRELSEVHLLLDHISAHPDKLLPVATVGSDVLLPSDWLRRVCEIEWPVDEVGDTSREAAEADLLIRVKDHLNTVARPASGLTIAFSQLALHGRKQPTIDGVAVPSRRSLAIEAYPELATGAMWLRRFISAAFLFVAAWLALTCLVSWYVTVGNDALAQRRVAQVAYAEAVTTVEETAGANTPPGQAAGAGAKRPTFTGTNTTLPAFCFVDPDGRTSQQRLACDAVFNARSALAGADRQVTAWCGSCSFGVLAWLGIRKSRYEATTIAGLVGGTVLPFLYGVLGAAAAMLLTLSRKTRQSLLSPRDIRLSFQQLVLGAVTGASIGIFIAAPAVVAEGTNAFVRPTTLSASALSFLAGFGADAVFAVLDTTIKRVFNIAPPPPPTQPIIVRAG